MRVIKTNFYSQLVAFILNELEFINTNRYEIPKSFDAGIGVVEEKLEQYEESLKKASVELNKACEALEFLGSQRVYSQKDKLAMFNRLMGQKKNRLHLSGIMDLKIVAK